MRTGHPHEARADLNTTPVVCQHKRGPNRPGVWRLEHGTNPEPARAATGLVTRAAGESVPCRKSASPRDRRPVGE